jgi:iron-sulfur cluster assembly protein
MITVTKAAETFMKEMLDSRGHGDGIRFRILQTGCSGYEYKIEYADTITEHDTITKLDNLNIIIDKKSEVFLDGSEIDFVKEKLKEGLVFNNPNSKGTCGCGESFTI